MDVRSDELRLFNAGVFLGEIFFKRPGAMLSQPSWQDKVEELCTVLCTHNKV